MIEEPGDDLLLRDDVAPLNFSWDDRGDGPGAGPDWASWQEPDLAVPPVPEVRRLTERANARASAGDLAGAEVLLREALDQIRATSGEPHLDYVAGLARLASLLQRRGDFDTAEPLLRQALALHGDLLGTGHVDYAVSLNNLAMLLLRRNRPDEAEALLRQAHEVVRGSAAGEAHPRFGTVLNNLALVLQQRGDLAHAEALLRKALNHRREHLGGSHPAYATTLSSLGLVHLKQGEPGWAKLLYRESLGVRRQCLGPSHPLTVQNLFDLALIAWSQRDWERADALLAEILEAQRASCGERHPDYAVSLSLRAAVLRRRKDLDGAEDHLRRALAVRKDALGERHPLYANSLSNLALVLLRRGDRGGAQDLLLQALTVRKLALGEDHPDYLRNVGQLEALTSDNAEAEAVAPPSPPPPPATGPPSVEAPAGFEPPAATDRPAPDEPPARRPWSQPMPTSSRDLSRELEVLGEALAGLGERFLLAASQLHHPGAFPEPSLLDDLAARRREFAELRDRVVREAEALEMPPPPEPPDTVQGVARVVEALAREEAKREGLGAARRRAGEVLEGVRRLTYQGPSPLPALAACQDAAGALAATLGGAGNADLSEDEVRLADGTHPLARLLHLVENRESLDVDEWAGLYDAVVAAFGKTLAAAVAMSRVNLPPAEGPAPEAEGRNGRQALAASAPGAGS